MIVETDDIDGTALEQVVIRRRLIATSSDGARGVITLDYLSQMLGKERLHRELAILGQCRGIVTCIENKVGLFESKCISIS